MTISRPLIDSLRLLGEQADSVPHLERQLADLTTRLSQVADERAHCLERLEEGRAASIKLASAEHLLGDLLSGALVLPAGYPAPSPADLPASNSGFNSGSNSESAALPEPHETEALSDDDADKPAPTAAIAHRAADPSASNSEFNSGSNSETGAEPAFAPPTDAQRVRAWALASVGVFTAEDAATALGLDTKVTGRHLPTLIGEGLLERLPGTGVTGVPSRYQRPGLVVEAEPTGTVDTDPFRTLLADGRARTAREIADELGLDPKKTSYQLSRRVAIGQIVLDGEWPAAYSLPGQATIQAAPVTVPVVSPQPEAPAEPVATPPRPQAPKERDESDRRAIHEAARQPAALPPMKSKPITDSDRQAVLNALKERPNGAASASLLSRGAAMSTERVKEVLLNLADGGLVIAPEEGEYQWRLA